MNFALLSALLGQAPQTKQTVRVVANPQFTRNLFGTKADVAGKELQLIERNSQGDCLCVFDGKYIVDVDHRDVEPNKTTI